MIGDVRDKTAVILDDIIDTAGTLTAAGQTVLDEGAARVFAACTHPVFSGPAYERLANSAFEQVVVTDTIPLRPGAPTTWWFSPAPRCSPTRSARSSPTGRSAPCSGARTSCSSVPVREADRDRDRTFLALDRLGASVGGEHLAAVSGNRLHRAGDVRVNRSGSLIS